MDDPLTPELAREASDLQIAKYFHWTLDYIESLDDFRYNTIQGFIDGMTKIKRHEAIKAKNRAKV